MNYTHRPDAANRSTETPYEPLQYRPLSVSLVAQRKPSAKYDHALELSVHQQLGGRSVSVALGEKGVKPGHGVIMTDEVLSVARGRFLDLCSGPVAYFSHLALLAGCTDVLAVDLNPSFSTVEVPFANSDLLESVDPALRFGAAALHPPMLPRTAGSSSEDRFAAYDYADEGGRGTLDRAIHDTAKVLDQGGQLVIGQFEYLGVGRRMGRRKCTAEVLASSGYSLVSEKYVWVPMTPVIEAALDDIRAEFPLFEPQLSSGRQYHRFAVVVARRH